jgi:hypothetical protein
MPSVKANTGRQNFTAQPRLFVGFGVGEATELVSKLECYVYPVNVSMCGSRWRLRAARQL